MTSPRLLIGRALLIAAGLIAVGSQAASAPPDSATANVVAHRVLPPPRTFSLAATGDILTEDLVNQSAALSQTNVTLRNLNLVLGDSLTITGAGWIIEGCAANRWTPCFLRGPAGHRP